MEEKPEQTVVEPEKTDVPVAMTIKLVLGGTVVLYLLLGLLWLGYRERLHEAAEPRERLARETERILSFLPETVPVQTEPPAAYAWVDLEKGIVQIPIERAMELIVEEQRHVTVP